MQTNPYGVASLWGQSDLIIKGVALILLVMSIASWYVMVTKAWRAYKLRQSRLAAERFWHTRSYAEGLSILDSAGADNPFRFLALEAQAATEHHTTNAEDLHGQLGLSEWVTESLRGAIDECTQRLQSGLSILASIGSTAPFVGLFGTVWGIYHALISIGTSGQASIDKVAGPVGEALIMTAFGLAVAIPAVLGYNALNRTNRRISGQMHRFARQLHAYFLIGSPPASSTLASAAQPERT